PNRSSATHRMPDGICRIGIRQPMHFRYLLLFGNEIKRERWVDQEVNHPEERRNSVRGYQKQRLWLHYLAKFNPLASIS
ncbi:MAG TPA: hypothetical protein PLJ85_05295, partial [Candidatus Cloacimonas sp.]|nr:hypothetical protein [Candidatus Cloacimonas sp.]